ncbi:FAD-dependent monooxygenase [Methylobacterium sp. GC_Met_2]|uniref:FAD-dependent monooxygenase n=1 Tax=Methylobacterium sp. GC_Met_2 TaxID=2937376 RepID=UPI00226B38A0|nr:FAD-dependent monooxygenase [Methylobacterium sp. GC_Met_2]
MVGTTTSRTDCDVLVVGAGPTGLMAATLLARRGVRVRILDARSEASRESRAFAIQARTMELFQQIGLVDTFLDQGIVNPGIDFFVGGRRVGGFDYDRAASPDTPYPFIFLLPQSRTEAILIDDLSRHGVMVERDVTVTGLDQDGGGVTVHADSASSGSIEVRARYVIGADGAHSAVRKVLGLTFAGAKYAPTFLLADCRIDWPAGSGLDHDRFRVFLHGASVALFLPLNGTRCSRVMATDHSGRVDAGGEAATRLGLPELERAFSEAAGLAVRLSEPAWTTRYRVHHRGVDHYGRGRAFLAGDAAHIHSPAGGQGMNTGLQDAANLAWKLAAVIRDRSPADLLDTYDAERRPVGQQVVDTSDRMFTAVAGQTGWEATIRDWLARPVSAAIAHLDAVQHRAFRRLGQLEIAYPVGSYVGDGASALGHSGPQVGHRAPNAAVSRDQSVFDLTTGYGFTVLAFSRKALERDMRHRIVDELDALRRDGVTAYLIARNAIGRDGRSVAATSPDAFDRYGLRERDGQAIYVIRPDGYVAWRGEGLDVAGCGRFLERLAPKAVSHG